MAGRQRERMVVYGATNAKNVARERSENVPRFKKNV